MNTKYIIRCNKYWRVKVRIGAEFHNKCFAFGQYSDEESALRAAVRWRNKVLRAYGLIDRLKYRKAPDIFRQHPFGPIIGIHLNFNPSNDQWNWVVRYSIKEKEHKNAFSCTKYGSHKAFLMACETRFKYAGSLVVVRPDLMPCEPRVPFEIRPVSGSRPV